MTRAWQRMARWVLGAMILAAVALGGLAAIASADPATSTLTVTLAGTGAGSVTSDPAGLTCTGSTCTGSFDPSTTVTLTAVPVAGDGFAGFSGDCVSATTTCQLTPASDANITATFDAPPVLTVTAPTDGADYAQALVPVAAFTCPGATCSATVDGTTSINPGDQLPSTPGSHPFTVTATAADGGSVSQSGTYTVYPPPTCGDVGATTNEGAPVLVPLSCSDPNATSVTYAIDRRPRDGTLSRSHGLVTYTPGAGFAGVDTFTYHGTSADGDSATQKATITVLGPPSARIATPASGQVYTVGQSVPTRFSCADDPNGPGIRSCADSGGASDGAGTLDTSTEGSHSYVVNAMSSDGQSGRATITYTVVGKSPEVVITAPINNAAYLWTGLPAADFTCIAGAGSTVQSCKATAGGQAISDGQALPNALGTHTVSVTATDADGLSATQTAIYTVTYSAVPPPPVSIEAPAQGASYRLGQAVAARYSCAAATTGPALQSCVGTVPAGHRINTATLGAHPFSVSATNDQGESTTETVSYKVVPTTNRFVVVRLRATGSGAARLALKLPGPGSVRVIATAWNAAAGASRRRLAYGTASAGARRGGPLALVVQPTAAGRALLGTHGARPVIALAVTYKPPGARARVLRPKPLRLS